MSVTPSVGESPGIPSRDPGISPGKGNLCLSVKGTHNPRIQARKCVASNAEYPTHIAVGRDSHPLPNCVLNNYVAATYE